MKEELIHIITLKSKIRIDLAKRSKTNDITRRETREIERDLTRVLQKQIEKQGHVDTGLMVRTIRVKVRPNRQGRMIVDINAVDYWKYVNGNFDIFENAQRTRAWKKTEGDFNFYNRGVR